MNSPDKISNTSGTRVQVMKTVIYLRNNDDKSFMLAPIKNFGKIKVYYLNYLIILCLRVREFRLILLNVFYKTRISHISLRLF